MSIQNTFVPATAGPVAGLLSLRKAWLTIDRNPDAVGFVARPTGTAAVIAAYAAAAGLSFQISAPSLILIVATLSLIASH